MHNSCMVLFHAFFIAAQNQFIIKIPQMSRKKVKKTKIYPQVRVSDEFYKGYFLAEAENRKLIMEHTLPGDVVDAKVVGRKKSYRQTIPLHFHEHSSLRKEPFCEHFGTCGGCRWQNLQYEQQTHYKEKQVEEAFAELAQTHKLTFDPIISANTHKYYRNKLDYSFSNRRWLEKTELGQEIENYDGLGFHVPNRFEKIVDIKNCYLQPEPSNQIRLAIKDYAVEHQLSFFDIIKKEGLLRNLMIRTTETGEVMVVLILFYSDPEKITGLMEFLQKQFPQIVSLQYIVNSKANDNYQGLPVELVFGRDFVREKIADLEFKVRAQTFFQVNPEQTEKMYNLVRRWGNFQGDECVYDLYTGTGTIAHYIARDVRKVVGVECIPTAIEDAWENGRLNQINNVHFVVGQAEKILGEEFFQEHGKPDIVITDPPRAGMHPKVLKMLLRIAPKRIIYVSCNPMTQAKDISVLQEKYQLERVQPVDMFPHTHHVENVALLLRRE